ncbi:hypothetical protein ACF0H5_006434 [Mactra antiquata]
MVTKQQSSPLSLARNPIIIEMLKSKVKSNLCKQHSKSLPVTPVNPITSDNITDVPSSSDTVVPDTTSTSVPYNNIVQSTPRSLKDDDKLQKFMTGIDQDNVNKLKEIGQDIQTFDKRTNLKRSQTFDHSDSTLKSPSLKLSLSIQHFDKEKSLKRTSTFDKSSMLLRSLEHSMSIQHFDMSSLKHVDPTDRGSPLHIYSLVRSYSAYHDDTHTPDDHSVNMKSDIQPVEESSEPEVIESSELDDKGIDDSIDSHIVEELSTPEVTESSKIDDKDIGNFADVQIVEELSTPKLIESSELDNKGIDNSNKTVDNFEEFPSDFDSAKVGTASDNTGSKEFQSSDSEHQEVKVGHSVNEGSQYEGPNRGNSSDTNQKEIETDSEPAYKTVDDSKESLTENNDAIDDNESRDFNKLKCESGKVEEDNSTNESDAMNENAGPILGSNSLDVEQKESETKVNEVECVSNEKLDSGYVVIGNN